MESYDGRDDGEEDRIPRFVKNGLESKALRVRKRRRGRRESNGGIYEIQDLEVDGGRE